MVYLLCSHWFLRYCWLFLYLYTETVLSRTKTDIWPRLSCPSFANPVICLLDALNLNFLALLSQSFINCCVLYETLTSAICDVDTFCHIMWVNLFIFSSSVPICCFNELNLSLNTLNFSAVIIDFLHVRIFFVHCNV